jgi:uncharacterized phiE125 gp8 family phage protein
MTFNYIYSETDVTSESGVFEEPVSLDEMKDYLRLEGYVDSAESTSDELSDFDFDDRLLTELITTSREKVESLTGTYIIPKTIEVVFTNDCGMIELPGPNTQLTELLDSEDAEITSDNYKLIGGMWKYLAYPCYCNMTATLEVGYETCPKDLKKEIMRYTSYLYENRGDESVEPFSFKIAGKYMKKSGIA